MNTENNIPSELPEPNQAWRGHDFWPSQAVLGRVPALYASESTPARDKVVHLHYFVGGSDWWVVELDLSERLAFGYVRLSAHPDGAEWGYIDLVELASVFVPPVFPYGLGEMTVVQPPLIVERDLGWRPQPAGDCISGL